MKLALGFYINKPNLGDKLCLSTDKLRLPALFVPENMQKSRITEGEKYLSSTSVVRN
ncbi:hypothetical protein [Photobacterium sp. Hal280]|uniref:hypothetical protein n=1 Tax=Photobacterium sp. Hal280 TaxID=3035163 RepID=UPI00301D283A